MSSIADRAIVQILSDETVHDIYYLGPEGIPGEGAAAIADILMAQVIEANSEDYLFEDFDALLLDCGFVRAEIFQTQTTW